MPVNNRVEIVSAFKLAGFVLEASGRNLIEQHLSAIKSHRKWQDELSRIVDFITSNPDLSSAKVTSDIVEEALSKSQETDISAVDDVLILDHKSLDVHLYDACRKEFVKHSASLRSFQSIEPAISRIDAFRERFQIIHQRVLNHQLFRKPIVTQADGNYRELTPLSGIRGIQGECAVLGLLTQLREGVFCLEDLSHSIEVEMTPETLASAGLFTENCIVLAEGEMISEKFRISVLAMPPVEERSETCKRFPMLASLYQSATSNDASGAIDDKTSIIVLSDVWLDRAKVQMGLKLLFKDFNKQCAEYKGQTDGEQFIFVFMGDFTSLPSSCGYELHRSLFEQLGHLLQSFPALMERSSFVFLPGPGDSFTGSARLLPRPAFPDVVTADLSRHVPGAVFTSSPCRIKFYSQEIVLFREDVAAKLRSHSRRPRDDGAELWSHAVKTLLSQSHLLPVALDAAPVDWTFDHALRLYPLPHALIIGSRGREALLHERGVKVACPGSFAADFAFAAYRPFRGERPAGKGRDFQAELEIMALDVGEIDRLVALDRAKDEPPPPKKKKRLAEPRRAAAAGPIEKPEEESRGPAPAAASAIGSGRSRKPKAMREGGAASAAKSDGKNQLQIGSFFMAGAMAAGTSTASGRRRLVRGGGSDDSDGGEGDVAIVGDAGDDTIAAVLPGAAGVARRRGLARSVESDEELGSNDGRKRGRGETEVGEEADGVVLGRSRRKRVVVEEEEDPEGAAKQVVETEELDGQTGDIGSDGYGQEVEEGVLSDEDGANEMEELEDVEEQQESGLETGDNE